MAPKRQPQKSPSGIRVKQRAKPTAIVASTEKISNLIGTIYDCILVPQQWRLVLETINRELRFAAGALGVMSLRTGGETLTVNVGFDPAWLRDANARQSEVAACWGGTARLANCPLDEPIVATQSPGFAGWDNIPYCREVLSPRGIIDAVGIGVIREPTLLGYAAFSRHQSAGGVSAMEIDGLRLLAPHFRRAITISNLFDMKAMEATSFASVLDSLSFGLVLVDAQLGVVHANAVAARMLVAGDPIESRNGAVALRDRASGAALERAVQQAGLDETTMGPRGIGIPARRIEGEPCVIHVLPLKSGEMRRSLSQRATAALFIVPAAGLPHMPSDAVAVLYDLTPAETRIFEMIVEGQTQSTIADTLGIARSTVKSHMLHLLAKCGCKRQADLLRLATRLASPA